MGEGEKIGSMVDGFFNRVRDNPWIASTIFLIIVLAFVIIFGGPGISGGSVSDKTAGENLISFVNAQSAEKASLISIEKDGTFYKAVVEYKGQEIPVLVSLDGKYLISGAVPLSIEPINNSGADETPAEITKSDKPNVDLYIFSYCPAGTAALDSFAKTALLMKNVANLKVKFYSDMHGAHEKQQNMVQECIQDIDAGKYWAYANQYVARVYSACAMSKDVACDRNESTSLMNAVGIDSAKVFACVSQRGDNLYQKDKADANTLQLMYSPSFVINGVYLENIDRTPEGIQSSICSAFNEAPSECSQKISVSSNVSSTGSCNS